MRKPLKMVSLLLIYSVCISGSLFNNWRRVALLQEGLDLNQKLYDEGLGESLTLDRLTLSIDQINTQIDYAEVNLANAMANLRYVMNVGPDAVIYLEDSIQHYAEESLDHLATYQYTSLPEYRVLEINDQLRFYDIAQARAQLYPSIYLFGYYGVLAQRSSFPFLRRDQTTDGLILEP